MTVLKPYDRVIDNEKILGINIRLSNTLVSRNRMRKRINALAEQLLDTLEQKGYRSTEPRRAMAQVIANQDKHFTAEDLRKQLPS